MPAAVAAVVASVALVVAPGGLNPFGPAKLLVTYAGAALVCVALARGPGLGARLHALVRTPVPQTAAALLCVAALSLATVADPRLAVIGPYPGYAGLLAAAAWLTVGLAAGVAEPGELRVAAGRGIVVAAIGVGLLALAERFGLGALTGSAGVRIGSTLGNASNLGVWLALAVSVLADRAITERGAWRTVAWASLALAAASSALTGSRGGWIGFAVALVLWTVLSLRGDASLRAVGLPVLVAAVVFASALALTPAAAERASGGGTAASTAAGRLAVWESTLPMIAERPVLGWGPAAYGAVHPRYATASEVDPTGRSEALEDPHNVFLSVGASTGGVGLAAVLALIGAVVWTVLRPRARDTGSWVAVLASSLGGGLAALQFHFVTLESGILMAALAGAVAGAGLAAPSVSAAVAQWTARGALATAVVFGVCAVGAAGLVVADVGLRTGLSAAAAGDWDASRATLETARALAAWEPAVDRAMGRAATIAATASPDSAIIATGEAALERAARHMPDDARPIRELGDLRLAAALGTGGEWAAAARLAYDEALTLSPLDPRSWLGRGVASLVAGEYEAAERDLLRALALAPGFADAWENLAAVYDATDRPSEAAEARARLTRETE